MISPSHWDFVTNPAARDRLGSTSIRFVRFKGPSVCRAAKDVEITTAVVTVFPVTA